MHTFATRGVPRSGTLKMHARVVARELGIEVQTDREPEHPFRVRDRYHQPSDDLNQPVDRDAAAKFNRVIMSLRRDVADDTKRPTWNADSFFKRFATR